jgi:hypothetical protein
MGAESVTTPADSRSQRNRASRRGGQLPAYRIDRPAAHLRALGAFDSGRRPRRGDQPDRGRK